MTHLTAPPAPPRGAAQDPPRTRRVAAVLGAALALAATAWVYQTALALRLGIPALLLTFVVSVPLLLLAATAVRTRRPRDGAALLIPAVAFVAVFLLLPALVIVAYALATQRGFGGVEFGLSFANFGRSVNDITLGAFWRTLGLAAAGTALTVLAGLPLAYWLARFAGPRLRMWGMALVMLPFLTSFLVRTYAFLIVLSDQFPVLRGLRRLGLLGEDATLLGTPTAVLIGLTYTYLPLFVLPAFSALERMDWSLIRAAGDLGAPRWKAFLQITLPLSLPGLTTGALLVFIPMTGDYLVPQILGGGRVDLMGNLISRAFLEEQNYPSGAALALLMTAALSVLTLLHLRPGRRSGTRHG
ncbi:ABC transporter permease [Streptomyces sp. URMC 129]|uniref:ABC transporter permease n=1 Tax=Streptomyces sp. URMC 129 TaxID=3423407 RepID=UPI003F19CBF7